MKRGKTRPVEEGKFFHEAAVQISQTSVRHPASDLQADALVNEEKRINRRLFGTVSLKRGERAALIFIIHN